MDQSRSVIDGHATAVEYVFNRCSEFVAQVRMYADQSLVLFRESLTLPRRLFRFIEVREIGEQVHFRELSLGLQFLAALLGCWLAGEFNDARIFPRPLDPAQAVTMILLSFPKGIGRW
jgi:hypothetical protein